VAIRAPKNRFPSPTTWTLPPTGFIKINFDGASKGNPGPAGYGAVIRSSKGEILALIVGYLGETTNNVAELTGLLQGLRHAVTLASHKIILEGDSQIIIQLITKILHGGNPQKISPSWRLAGLLKDFKSLLGHNISIIPSHIKREANGVADYLANEGLQRETKQIIWDARSTGASDLYKHCQLLANKDFPAPNGVIHGKGEARGGELGEAIYNGSHHTLSYL
jgi:ribonuclease HI